MKYLIKKVKIRSYIKLHFGRIWKEQPLSTHTDRYDENRSYHCIIRKRLFIFNAIGISSWKRNLMKTVKRF
jgi:hypothetical protein